MHGTDSLTDQRPARRLVNFQVTKQHRRFCEFADAVRRFRYIGLCYGAPGLGKTLSARTYSAADDWDKWWHDRYYRDTTLPDTVLATKTAFYTPEVHITGRRLGMEVHRWAHWLSNDIHRALEPGRHPEFDDDITELPLRAELIIIDESDRANATGLEELRDFFDREDIGMILIGMPGFERRLARYPQLYSRVGFAHQYRPLDAEDIPGVLAQYWQRLELPPGQLDPGSEVVAAITRITGGNFRLIERLMAQTDRLLEINHLETVTPDLIEAARKTLVIGAQ